MSVLDQVLLFVASFVANWFSALSGGGAGLIQFPMLIFLGLPFGVALATHKVATVFLGLGAALRHLRECHLERRFSLIILVAGLPGVAIGASAILYLPERPAILALGILTLGLGLYSLVKPRLGMEYRPRNREGAGLVVGMAGMFLVGFLNGSITSGSGLFLTIWLIRHFGLDYQRAVAYTMILGGLFWNGTGAAVLGVLGTVQWDWMPVLLAGAVIGGYLGSHVAIVKGNLWVKRAFEVTTVLIGLKLIIG
ncbi:MAG: sulfite exporter TauE/SafE family protein [Gallionellaceae bacterium]|nr:sulfite exporter TauE/SafE family protein [Gallionellaceae bacterium]